MSKKDILEEQAEKEHKLMKQCPKCGSTNTFPNLGSGMVHATISRNGKMYSVLSYVCHDCGNKYSKEFDVTEIFKKFTEEVEETTEETDYCPRCGKKTLVKTHKVLTGAGSDHCKSCGYHATVLT